MFYSSRGRQSKVLGADARGVPEPQLRLRKVPDPEGLAAGQGRELRIPNPICFVGFYFS